MGVPDRRAIFESLVMEHYAALYRYAYRLSGSASDAEDLTQETFCKAQMLYDQLRDTSRVRSWLFSILRNAYLHHARAERNHREVSLDHAGDVPEAVDLNIQTVDSEQLQQALAELPETFRTPVILYYFEDFSYREIADQMELPLGTVMSRLSRAKEYLYKRLSPAAESAPCRGRANNGLS
jgi:RNA polymerase sigma-70 factor (ECF subfamily)